MKEKMKELFAKFEGSKGKKITKYSLEVSELDNFTRIKVRDYYVIAEGPFDFFMVCEESDNIETLGKTYSVNSPYIINLLSVTPRAGMVSNISIVLFTDKEKDKAVKMLRSSFYEYIDKKEWYKEESVRDIVDNLLCSI